MKLKYYNMLLGLLLMASCSKEIKVAKAPGFDVTTEATTYKVGQEITFNIKGGDADIISFYSGETLNDYAFKDGRAIDVKGAGATMAFQSSVQLGTQANQLSILASTDFNGDYSSLAKVKAATWTDITSRFALGTKTVFLASGTKEISDLMVPGKPIYIAFKYVTKPQATNGLARNWFIQAFVIKSDTMLNNTVSLNLTDQPNAGFRIVDENQENAPALSLITSTRVSLYGNIYKNPSDPIYDPTNPIFDPLNPIYDPQSPSYIPTAVRPTYVPYDSTSPYNDPLSENWAISKPINTEKVDLGPDWSASIKGISNPNLSVYRYTYTNAGTYKAFFIASNNSIDDTKQVVKEVDITITQ
jgi:hypothetical protein